MTLCLIQPMAQAALFEDDEARRAILDLRQRVEQLSGSGSAQGKAQTEEILKLRSALLDLQNQIESLKSDQARLRGTNEQLMRDLSELQQRQKDVQLGLDDRLRKFEPIKVNLEGVDFLADPAEKRDYDAAIRFNKRNLKRKVPDDYIEKVAQDIRQRVQDFEREFRIAYLDKFNQMLKVKRR